MWLANAFRCWVPSEPRLASTLQGAEEGVSRAVSRGVAEHRAQRLLAVPPYRQSRFEVEDLDGAGAVGEGVHDAQAQELGLGSGRESVCESSSVDVISAARALTDGADGTPGKWST
jgi:hypothetical protein